MADSDADDIDNEYEDDDEENEERPPCPYCDSEDDCPHLLLRVSVTFNKFEGPLAAPVESSWSELLETHEEDNRFDERDALDKLLFDVARAADAENEYVFDGTPRLSGRVRIFWCETSERVQQLLKDGENG